MSLQYSDIFDDIADRLNASINPYVTKLVNGIESGDLPIYYGPRLQGMKGKWNGVFSESTNKPIVLEIGCHKGDTFRQMASDHPELNFLGMDITFKRVVTTAERCHNAGLKNGAVVLGSARFLDAVVEDDELSGVVLFFPDPWSKKKRQARHRLMSREFASVLKRKIRPGGFFWIKTDSELYFKSASNYVLESGFSCGKSSLPDRKLGPLLERSYESTFERKFRLEGVPTYGRVFVSPQENL